MNYSPSALAGRVSGGWICHARTPVLSEGVSKTVTGFRLESDILATSCFSKQIDAARRTMSFIRNGTWPAIAGKPAAGSQPPGMNGMIVRVVRNVTVEPRAPRIPNLLSQNPAYKSAQIVHSEAPRNRAPPRRPKAGYSQKMNGLLLMKGIIACAPY